MLRRFLSHMEIKLSIKLEEKKVVGFLVWSDDMIEIMETCRVFIKTSKVDWDRSNNLNYIERKSCDFWEEKASQ